MKYNVLQSIPSYYKEGYQGDYPEIVIDRTHYENLIDEIK